MTPFDIIHISDTITTVGFGTHTTKHNYWHSAFQISPCFVKKKRNFDINFYGFRLPRNTFLHILHDLGTLQFVCNFQ